MENARLGAASLGAHPSDRACAVLRKRLGIGVDAQLADTGHVRTPERRALYDALVEMAACALVGTDRFVQARAMRGCGKTFASAMLAVAWLNAPKLVAASNARVSCLVLCFPSTAEARACAGRAIAAHAQRVDATPITTAHLNDAFHIAGRARRRHIIFIGANTGAIARVTTYAVDLVVVEHADLFPDGARALVRAWNAPLVAWTTDGPL
jgi:hypothetical protein